MNTLIKTIAKRYNKLDSNSRIIVFNIMFSFLIKGGAMLISYLMMPAYLHFFKQNETLGLWFTILSVLLLVFHFNLGIGNGLRNHLSSALAVEDYEKAQELTSSAYFYIGILSLFLTFMIFVFSCFFDLNSLFHIEVTLIPSESLRMVVWIVLVGLMLNFVLGIINYIFFAMQYAFAPSFLSLVTSLSMLVGVLICPSGTAPQNLLRMALIHVVSLNFPLLLASIFVFRKKLKKIAPSLMKVSWRCGRSLLKLGGAFFYVQIVYLVIMGINEYLISALTNNCDVVEYQIYYKLFVLVGTLFAISLTPVWSVVTKAIAETKYLWVQSLYRKTSLLALFACVFEFLMLVFLQPIVNFWLKDNALTIDSFYSVVFAIFGSLLIYTQVLSSFANGMGALKTQAIVYTIGAILKVPLSLFFIRLSDSWIGVVLATDVILLAYCVVQPVTIRGQFLKFRE